MDAIVIGAGAAGLTAARRLHAVGLEVVVLEARARTGGRVLTDTTFAGYPLDLGAEFIHGERVCTWEWVRRLGLRTLPAPGPQDLFLSLDGQLLDSGALTAAARERGSGDDEPFAILDAASGAWTAAANPDASLLDAVDAEMKRRGRVAASGWWQVWNAGAAVEWGADLDRLGVQGIVEATYDGDGDRDYRIAEGYAPIIAALAEGLDIRLERPVERVEWGAGGVRVVAAGETFHAAAAVVTLAIGVLKAGRVVFDPPLPAEKQAAIDGLRAGAVSKLLLRFAEPFWPEVLGRVLSDQGAHNWVRPGWGRDDETPVLRALIGGRAAERLATKGSAAIAEALEQLATIVGPDAAKRIRFMDARVVHWGDDPWARTGYSYVPPGGAGLRALLAAPVANTLFFAGEATHSLRPTTVHGAIESGERAAREVLAR